MTTRNPYVFAVGCPRSGTTLLQRLLDAHRDLAVVNETGWITNLPRSRDRVTAGGLVTEAAVHALCRHARFERLELPSRRLDDLVGLPYPVFVARVFDRVAEARGKPLAGDKTPRYVALIGELHRLFPQAKFVHLIRDGRDVCLSALDWDKAGRFFRRFPSWRHDPVATVALWWERNTLLARESGAALGAGLYHEVRYEDLVADPQRGCEGLCSFLQIPFDAEMLTFHEGRVRSDEGLTTKRRWLPPTPGVRDWRAQMPLAELQTFEEAAGGLLDDLGYELGARRRPGPSLAAVRDTRTRFTNDLRRRGRPLPKAWAA